MPRIASASSLVLVAALAATASVDVNAWPQFLSMVPNGRAVDFGVVNLGHAEGSLLRNPFGRAFGVDRNWTKAFCQTDSDGDGQTNGEELGDPCCVWSIGKDSLLQRTNGTSNPGNKSSTADPNLWKNVDCTLAASAAASAASTSAPAPAATTSSAALPYVAGASTLLVATVFAFN